MQRCEFMIRGRHKLHEMVSYHVRMVAMQRTFKVGVDNALFRNFFFNVVIYELRIVLGSHTGKAFSHYRIAMVLARDKCPGAKHIADRLVRTAVTVLQFHRVATHGQCRKLVAQTDAKHR